MIFSTWFPYPRNTFLLNHLRNKGVWGRDCFQQLSWVLKYRTGCWGTTRCFAWWENVPGTKQQKTTNQKTGTTFHRNLFMNPLLEHIFEIARCTFYSIIPMGSLRSDTWLTFTNGQEITCCNVINFFNAWSPAGTSNHLRFSNSQEINWQCQVFVHNFFSPLENSYCKQTPPLSPQWSCSQVRTNYSDWTCCWNDVYQIKVRANKDCLDYLVYNKT